MNAKGKPVCLSCHSLYHESMATDNHPHPEHCVDCRGKLLALERRAKQEQERAERLKGDVPVDVRGELRLLEAIAAK